jgi:adenosine deaminase/aminodeoxyfutalosine deaminase
MKLAELHLHLEGSVEPETMRELDPRLTLDEIRARYRVPDFAGFIECFKWVSGCLHTPADYELITRRLLERLAAQNVVYAEITLAAGVILWKEQDAHAVYDAVRRAAADSPVEVHWIFDAVRHFGADHGMAVARLAAERAKDGVVAFGLGGDESRGPASWFADAFRYARDHGLHTVAHAGETTNSASVWEAIRIGAERIGHGIRAADDPALLSYLREHDIPLEICISSNVATGAVADLQSHPAKVIFDSGVPLTLNTDDPGIFGTTLSREYQIARQALGFSEDELSAMAANSFRYRFGAEARSGQAGRQ